MKKTAISSDAARLARAIVKNIRAMLYRRKWNDLGESQCDNEGFSWTCEVDGTHGEKRALVLSTEIARAAAAEFTGDGNDSDATYVSFDPTIQPPSSCGKARIGKRHVDRLLAEADSRGIGYLIFVSDELATPAAQADLCRGERVEYFHASELVHDPMCSAASIPTYRNVVDNDERNALFARWNAKATQFPAMNANDPICRYYGGAPGTVFEIVDTPTGNVRYRTVGDKK